jgi:ATP adenylyltransferase
MNHLHAYWRMQYIEAPKPAAANTTLFEDLPKTTDDKSVHLLHRGATAYLVLNRFPYNAGHLLAIPYRPVATLAGLTLAERAELMDMLVLAQQILTDALHPDGFNIGFNFGAAAGAGIPAHLHAHIVPRWQGDNNFMPVLGDTRVLSTSLDAMWSRLRAFCPKTIAPDSAAGKP